ncbi:MAG: hypothetical protein LBL73_03750 [Synergistaceae bacterium]|jgi:spore coat polysaccharide biosynthesis predicted glycosyltransferase SpsG|nr:hypothetical protein [Synergistaceae bacterium]
MKAVIVTNAGQNIGGGHLSRCFALSQALEAQGTACSWILNEGASHQAESLGIKDKIYLGDIFGPEALKSAAGYRFAVVDSYLAPEGFLRDISKAQKLVMIDDLYSKSAATYADAVINYGIGASRGLYGQGRCDYLLGPGYALLRREFWTLEPEERDYVLFAPGAADVADTAPGMARWWGADRPALVIALGPFVSAPRLEAVREISLGRGNIEIRHDAGDFPLLLSRARLVICTASVTAYEALAMEKRAAVFSVAPNQGAFGEKLTRMGVALDLGEWKDIGYHDICSALSYEPDAHSLKGLVKKDGALLCARRLLELFGGCSD